MIKYKKYFIYLLIPIFVIIQSWFIFVTLEYKWTSISLEKNEHNQWIVIDAQKPYDKFEIGDIILEVDGNHPDEHFTIQKWRSIEQFDQLFLLRDNQRIEITNDNLQVFLIDELLPYFGAIICFLIGIIIFIKLKNSNSARHLSLFLINAAIIFSSLGASVRGDTLAKIIIMNSMILLPLFFLHFLIIFFNEKGNLTLSTKYIKLLYYLIAGFVTFQLVLFYDHPFVYYIYFSFRIFLILNFCVIFLLIFGFLLKMYFKFKNEKSYLSLIVKTIMSSMIISFSPIIILSFIPLMLFGYEWVNSFYAGWFVLFFPITFAYLIGTKKIYDISSVMRRAFFTFLISLIPSLLLVLFTSLVLHDQLSFAQHSILFIISTFLFTAVLYSMEYIVNKFNAIIFPRKHLLQHTLKKISRSLTAISTLRELKETILIEIVKVLEVYGGAIAVRHRNRIEIISEGQISLYDVEKLVLKAQATDNYEQWSYSCFEIGRNEEGTSYLIITKKKNGAVLNPDERNWLGIVSSYLAVSLENLHLLGKLTLRMEQLSAKLPKENDKDEFNWFRKIIFDIQEKERFRIAGELHDTSMQDLFFLRRKLTNILASVKENDNRLELEDIEGLRSVMDYMKIVNNNLRQSCFELNPPMIGEEGLTDALQRLIDQEYDFTFELEFKSNGEQLLESSDIETKQHLFRIVQEWINNAKKHSQANHVSISLGVCENEIKLLYEDDGIGFEMKEHYYNPASIGLEQLKSRVLAMNGSLEVISALNMGVKYNVTIPR